MNDQPPTKLAEVVKLAERAAAAQDPMADDGFVARQASIRRSEHLRRADPDIPEADVRAIIAGRLKPTRPLDAVQRWWNNSDLPVLCLGGPKGTGKTVAGAWAIAEAGGVQVGAFDLARMAMEFKSSERFDAVTRVRVLLLDDLGTERCPPEDMEALLLHLINRRLARARRTIITTNQTPDQLRQRYPDERLWSRLVRSWAYIGCNGRDMREVPT